MQELAMVILACTVHVSDEGVKEFIDKKTNEFDQDTKACRTFEHTLNEELQETLTPWTCMMKSPIYLVEFMQSHPGMAPKRWTCKVVRPSKKT